MKAVALALSILALCAGPASAQHPDIPQAPDAFLDWAATVRVREEWAAFTVCIGLPSTWTNNEGITDDYRGMIDAHEANHREFMGSFSSCYAFHQWHYGNRAADIETEARAFCAGAQYEARTGRYAWMEAMLRGARIFGTYYGGTPGWNEAAALEEMLKYCKA